LDYLHEKDKGNLLPLYLEAYERYLTKWTITIAHETVHAFLTFLAGHEFALTPKDVAPPGYANILRGESGRLWEVRALGGAVEWRMSEEKDFFGRGIRAGSIWLKFCHDDEAARVAPSAIRDFVAGSKFTYCLGQSVPPWIESD
jgi:hypothetical protein